MNTEMLPEPELETMRSKWTDPVSSVTAMPEVLVPVMEDWTPAAKVPGELLLPRMTLAKPELLRTPESSVVATRRSGTPSPFTSATAMGWGTLTGGGGPMKHPPPQ